MTKKEQEKLFNTEYRINDPDKSKLWNDLKSILIEINLELTQMNNLKKIRKITEQPTKEGELKSKRFWKIRKNITDQGNAKPHVLITEENVRVTNPHKAKQYINIVKTYTKHEILDPIIKASQKNETLGNIIYEIIISNLPKMEEITMKELEIAIKKLKKGKESGPDDIPNEIFIHANKQYEYVVKS